MAAKLSLFLNSRRAATTRSTRRNGVSSNSIPCLLMCSRMLRSRVSDDRPCCIDLQQSSGWCRGTRSGFEDTVLHGVQHIVTPCKGDIIVVRTTVDQERQQRINGEVTQPGENTLENFYGPSPTRETSRVCFR